jgi:hypothetical protein
MTQLDESRHSMERYRWCQVRLLLEYLNHSVLIEVDCSTSIPWSMWAAHMLDVEKDQHGSPRCLPGCTIEESQRIAIEALEIARPWANHLDRPT